MPTADEVASEMNCIHIHMTSDQYWDPYDQTIDAHEAALRASLDQMPHERGRILSPIATIALMAAVQERTTASDLLSKSRSMIHALRRQPRLPVVLESDVRPTFKCATTIQERQDFT